MRLALISYEFPPETPGGIGTYAWHATRALVAAGHQVVVFSSRGSQQTCSETPTIPLPQGLEIRRLDCLDRRNFHKLAVPALAQAHRQQPFFTAEVPDLYAEGRGLRALAPDLPILLRCHTPCYIPSEIDRLALPPVGRVLSALRCLVGHIAKGRLHGLAHALRTRLNPASAYDPYTDPERAVAMEADLVVPPSHLLARRLLHDWFIPAERMRILPYAHIPDPALLALKPPAEAEYVSFHGGFRYFKGVHTLFDAMGQLMAARPQLRLLIAGQVGGSPVRNLSLSAWHQDKMLVWRDTLEWLRPRLASVWSRVEFTGFIPPHRIAAHLSRAHVCVFPSLFDNFPSACLEAMSGARAIVATRSGGMEEMLGDEEAGLLVHVDDADALARAIARLLDDTPLRLRLASAARQRVLSLCDPSRIAARHEELFKEAAALRYASSRNAIAS